MFSMRVAMAGVYLFGGQITGGSAITPNLHIFSIGQTRLVALQESLTKARLMAQEQSLAAAGIQVDGDRLLFDAASLGLKDVAGFQVKSYDQETGLMRGVFLKDDGKGGLAPYEEGVLVLGGTDAAKRLTGEEVPAGSVVMAKLGEGGYAVRIRAADGTLTTIPTPVSESVLKDLSVSSPAKAGEGAPAPKTIPGKATDAVREWLEQLPLPMKDLLKQITPYLPPGFKPGFLLKGDAGERETFFASIFGKAMELGDTGAATAAVLLGRIVKALPTGSELVLLASALGSVARDFEVVGGVDFGERFDGLMRVEGINGVELYEVAPGKTFESLGKVWEAGSQFELTPEGLKVMGGVVNEAAFGGIVRVDGKSVPVLYAGSADGVKAVGIDWGRVALGTSFKVVGKTDLEGFGTIYAGSFDYGRGKGGAQFNLKPGSLYEREGKGLVYLQAHLGEGVELEAKLTGDRLMVTVPSLKTADGQALDMSGQQLGGTLRGGRVEFESGVTAPLSMRGVFGTAGGEAKVRLTADRIEVTGWVRGDVAWGVPRGGGTEGEEGARSLEAGDYRVVGEEKGTYHLNGKVAVTEMGPQPFTEKTTFMVELEKGYRVGGGTYFQNESAEPFVVDGGNIRGGAESVIREETARVIHFIGVGGQEVGRVTFDHEWNLAEAVEPVSGATLDAKITTDIQGRRTLMIKAVGGAELSTRLLGFEMRRGNDHKWGFTSATGPMGGMVRRVPLVGEILNGGLAGVAAFAVGGLAGHWRNFLLTKGIEYQLKGKVLGRFGQAYYGTLQRMAEMGSEKLDGLRGTMERYAESRLVGLGTAEAVNGRDTSSVSLEVYAQGLGGMVGTVGTLSMLGTQSAERYRETGGGKITAWAVIKADVVEPLVQLLPHTTARDYREARERYGRGVATGLGVTKWVGMAVTVAGLAKGGAGILKATRAAAAEIGLVKGVPIRYSAGIRVLNASKVFAVRTTVFVADQAVGGVEYAFERAQVRTLTAKAALHANAARALGIDKTPGVTIHGVSGRRVWVGVDVRGADVLTTRKLTSIMRRAGQNGLEARLVFYGEKVAKRFEGTGGSRHVLALDARTLKGIEKVAGAKLARLELEQTGQRGAERVYQETEAAKRALWDETDRQLKDGKVKEEGLVGQRKDLVKGYGERVEKVEALVKKFSEDIQSGKAVSVDGFVEKLKELVPEWDGRYDAGGGEGFFAKVWRRFREGESPGGRDGGGLETARGKNSPGSKGSGGTGETPGGVRPEHRGFQATIEARLTGERATRAAERATRAAERATRAAERATREKVSSLERKIQSVGKENESLVKVRQGLSKEIRVAHEGAATAGRRVAALGARIEQLKRGNEFISQRVEHLSGTREGGVGVRLTALWTENEFDVERFLSAVNRTGLDPASPNPFLTSGGCDGKSNVAAWGRRAEKAGGREAGRWVNPVIETLGIAAAQEGPVYGDFPKVASDLLNGGGRDNETDPRRDDMNNGTSKWLNRIWDGATWTVNNVWEGTKIITTVTKDLATQTADQTMNATRRWAGQVVQAGVAVKDSAIETTNGAMRWTADVSRNAATNIHTAAVLYRDDMRTVAGAAIGAVKGVGEFTIKKANDGWNWSKERASAIAEPYSKNVSASFNEMTRADPVTANKLAIGLVASVFSGDIWDESMPIVFDKHGPAVITINGIMNTGADAIALRDAVGRSFGVEKLTMVANNTHTKGLQDGLQVAFQEYFGAIDAPAVQTAIAIRQGIKEKGEVFVVAHSQGTAIFDAALDLLSTAEKAHIHYLGLGPEKYVSDQMEGLADAKNVRNAGDIVPTLGNTARVSNWLMPTEWPRKVFADWTNIERNVPGNRHGFDQFYKQEVRRWAKERN